MLPPKPLAESVKITANALMEVALVSSMLLDQSLVHKVNRPHFEILCNALVGKHHKASCWTVGEGGQTTMVWELSV
jgi:hypothetical protein